MSKKYNFLFPDGYIYTSRINPRSALSEIITELRAAIFNEDKEQFDNSVQEIKFFYGGIFLNNEFTFIQIKYKDDCPIKVYIKPTPEAIKAKCLHYSKLTTIGFERKVYTEDEKEERINDEENRIRNEITNPEIKKLNSVTPHGTSESLMTLFYLEANRDMERITKYFSNIP